MLSAHKHFEGAIEINLSHQDAHFNLGNVQKEMGNYLDAISSYSTAIKLSPRHIKAYFNLARTYADLQLLDMAIKTTKKPWI